MNTLPKYDKGTTTDASSFCNAIMNSKNALVPKRPEINDKNKTFRLNVGWITRKIKNTKILWRITENMQ